MYKNLAEKEIAEAKAAKTIKRFKVGALIFVGFFAVAGIVEFGWNYFI